MPVAERAFADAERRLGRPLTEAELRIDIVRADQDLAEGKRRLAAAIEAEKRRVIQAQVRGLVAQMELTSRMVWALLWVYDAGRRHAAWEMGKMGVKRTREFAEFSERPVPPKIEKLVQAVQDRLPPINAKVANAVATQGDFGGLAGNAIVDRLAQTVPGPLAAAADLISSGFTAGLADVYGANADKFSGWQYTAVMDDNTCDYCQQYDGTEFPTLEEALTVMPDFGPNPLCFGGGRCRCRLVPVGPSEPPAVPPIDGGLSPAGEIASTVETYGAPLLRAAEAAEPMVTADLSEVAFRNGGEMAGLEFRFKSPASLERKILGDIADGRTPEQAVEGIWDALRYTTVYDTESYTASVQASLRELESRGYLEASRKNFWTEGQQYKGVNIQMVAPDGQRFELQFHTAESHYTKEILNHPLYEIYRDPNTDLATKRAVDREMTLNADKIPTPPDVEQLGALIHIARPSVMADDPTVTFPKKGELDLSTGGQLGDGITLNEVFYVEHEGAAYVVKTTEARTAPLGKFDPKLDAARERAAYIMARYFGDTDPAYTVRVAPVTPGRVKGYRDAIRNADRSPYSTHDELPDKIGASIARYVEGEIGVDSVGLGTIGEEPLRAAALFDLVIGNLDRHGANYIIKTVEGEFDRFSNPVNELWLIDHGLSFGPDTRLDRGSIVSSWIDRGNLDLGIGAIRFLEALQARRAEIDADLSPWLSTDLLEKMWARVDLLLTSRSLNIVKYG